MKIVEELEELIKERYQIPARVSFDRRKWRYWKSKVECFISEGPEDILLIVLLMPQRAKTNAVKLEEFREILTKTLDIYTPLIKRLITLKKETLFTRLAYFTEKGVDLPFWASDKKLENLTPSLIEQIDFFNKKTKKIFSTFFLKRRIKGTEKIYLRDGCMICEKDTQKELLIPFSFLRYIKDVESFEEFEEKIREEVALKIERLIEYLKGNENLEK